MLLGFDKYGKQYEDNPKEFFEEDFYMADMQKTETFNNDTFLQVFPEDPIIDIKELNADFEVENFEIEVFI